MLSVLLLPMLMLLLLSATTADSCEEWGAKVGVGVGSKVGVGVGVKVGVAVARRWE